MNKISKAFQQFVKTYNPRHPETTAEQSEDAPLSGSGHWAAGTTPAQNDTIVDLRDLMIEKTDVEDRSEDEFTLVQSTVIKHGNEYFKAVACGQEGHTVFAIIRPGMPPQLHPSTPLPLGFSLTVKASDDDQEVLEVAHDAHRADEQLVALVDANPPRELDGVPYFPVVGHDAVIGFRSAQGDWHPRLPAPVMTHSGNEPGELYQGRPASPFFHPVRDATEVPAEALWHPKYMNGRMYLPMRARDGSYGGHVDVTDGTLLGNPPLLDSRWKCQPVVVTVAGNRPVVLSPFDRNCVKYIDGKRCLPVMNDDFECVGFADIFGNPMGELALSMPSEITIDRSQATGPWHLKGATPASQHRLAMLEQAREAVEDFPVLHRNETIAPLLPDDGPQAPPDIEPSGSGNSSDGDSGDDVIKHYLPIVSPAVGVIGYATADGTMHPDLPRPPIGWGPAVAPEIVRTSGGKPFILDPSALSLAGEAEQGGHTAVVKDGVLTGYLANERNPRSMKLPACAEPLDGAVRREDGALEIGQPSWSAQALPLSQVMALAEDTPSTDQARPAAAHTILTEMDPSYLELAYRYGKKPALIGLAIALTLVSTAATLATQVRPAQQDDHVLHAHIGGNQTLFRELTDIAMRYLPNVTRTIADGMPPAEAGEFLRTKASGLVSMWQTGQRAVPPEAAEMLKAYLASVPVVAAGAARMVTPSQALMLITAVLLAQSMGLLG